MRSRVLRQLAWWLPALLLAGLGSVLLARAELARLRDAFETDARIVHRLLSQRAVQHDAVLATLALLQPPAGPDAAERRLPALYPQVLGVRRRDPGTAWPDAALAAAEAESRRLQRPALAAADLRTGRYDLVLAGEPASFALRLDLKAAVPWSEWPMAPDASPVLVTLQHGGGHFVIQPGRADGQSARWQFAFRKPLATDSQPFDVVTRRGVALAELPWFAMGGWTAAVAVLVAALQAWQRQRAARQRAEELLRLGQVARLNTLGELAAGMAHELNQPLAALLANTQAAQRLLADDPEELEAARGAMHHAVEQARRASDVVNRLRRTVERPAEAVAPQRVELARTVRSALALLEPECTRREVVVQFEEGPRPVAVLAEPVALEQVVHNLLMNALQALEQVPAPERRLHVQVRSVGDTGRLSVIDSGPGIPPEALPRVFEPFFSTRAAGLGLGLSLCETLANGMGGRLAAQNQPPRGAAFHLDLPLAPR